MIWGGFTSSRRVAYSFARLPRGCGPFSTSPVIRTRSAEEQSDFLENFIRQQTPPQADINYFSSLDWARDALDNDAYETVPTFSRYLMERTGENRFFARTVNTSTTVPHLVSLRLKDMKTPEPSTTAQDQSTKLPAGPEVITLMSLGPDLASHPSIVHGGFQCLIFDEVIRLLILLHQNNVRTPGPRDVHFTASMTTDYFAPVVAPSDVLVRAWLLRREGRKWFTKAELVGSDGRVLTGAEALWVTARKARRN